MLAALLVTLALPLAPASEPAPVDKSIDRYRTPIDVLNEGFLGAAARPVRFDWRRSPVMFGATASEILERNNFGAARVGVFARKPFGSLLGELALHWAWAVPTPSSELLALTPYRQASRPSRVELDLNLGYPVVEGVVTLWPGFLPPAEMVLSGVAGARYLFYPEELFNREFLDITGGLFLPALPLTAQAEIEPNLLPGMDLDLARYHVLGGFNLDVYFQPGLLISPRVLVAVPILAPATQTQLGFFWEMTISVGYAL